MSKRRPKSKIDKRPKSPTVASPTAMKDQTPLPPGVAKLEPDRTVIATREAFIRAPAEVCFGLIADQLEQPRQWDHVIVDVKPISQSRKQIGATSRVTLNLGGREVESLATISLYRPNRAIGWVLSEKPKIRQDWRLRAKPSGTMVSLTLSYEFPGWLLNRILYKVMRRKKVEQDLGKTLTQLGVAAQSIREQGGIGGDRIRSPGIR